RCGSHGIVSSTRRFSIVGSARSRQTPSSRSYWPQPAQHGGRPTARTMGCREPTTCAPCPDETGGGGAGIPDSVPVPMNQYNNPYQPPQMDVPALAPEAQSDPAAVPD